MKTLENANTRSRWIIPALKALFTFLFLYMTWVVIDTSLRSNLFEQWDFLAGIPWMTATLKDFYTNVAVLYLWVLWKETTAWKRILWLILLVGLGSIATTLYVLIQLFRLKPDDGIRELIIKRNGEQR
jgi:hypothetical protein